jgi:phosphoribosylaminoimidazole-succinocarboxamide synthase
VSAVDLPLLHSGKVRELYGLDDDHLLLVASDRISAFDVVFAEPVPDKGRVLTAMTGFWAESLDVPTHFDDVAAGVAELAEALDPDVRARSAVVRRAEMLPLECIVRGYLSGSAWKEYRARGAVHGEPLAQGMVESQQLREPRFTPSTKAEPGHHDENISFAEAAALVGGDAAARARELSLAAYTAAAQHAAARGVIIADTKFELGWVDGRLVIADELLTPDSSRLWPAGEYQPGGTPVSLDKQPIRDWAERIGWDKRPPAPSLPPEVVSATRARYVEAYERLTGRTFAAAGPVPSALDGKS